MEIEEILQKKRPEILDRWRSTIAQTYPAQTATILQAKGDRFRNPVGSAIFRQTAALFDALLNNESAERLSGHLDPLVRVRAVQDFTPAEAVGFVLQLKDVIRQAVSSEIQEDATASSLLQFETRIDALALVAFDCYVGCREQIYKLRAEEVKRQTQRVLDAASRTRGHAGEAVEGPL